MKSFEGKKVLISGGAGFIGSNLANELIRIGSDVEIIDAMIPEQGGNIHNLDGIMDKINFIKGDIRNEKITSERVKNKDFIFNLAAQTGHERSMKDPFTDLDINCKANLTLLEACRKYNSNVKIIYTGTRGQYGKILYNPVDEKHRMNPIDVNGISKLTGEMYHFLYNKIYGIKTTSLRLTNTYGPRHVMNNPNLGFINWFIRLAMDNKEIEVFDGKQLRDINFVDDVVRAILMVSVNSKTNGEAFNLGSGVAISILDLTKLIIKIMNGGSYRVVEFPKLRKKIEIGNYIACIDKISKTVGWTPKVGLENGLKITFDFYKKNKSKYW